MNSDGPHAIRAAGLEKTFTRKDGVFTIRVDAFALRKGEAALFQGESGAGKSTALALLSGLIEPDQRAAHDVEGAAGQIDFATETAAAARAFRAREFGFAPQTGGLLPYLTLRRNIEEAARLAAMVGGRRSPHSVEKLARTLKVEDALDLTPHAASVGQRQRASLARALAHGPSILVADEPSAALDFVNADRTDQLIVDCVAEFGMSALIVSHRPDRPHWRGAVRVSHRVEMNPKGGSISVFSL